MSAIDTITVELLEPGRSPQNMPSWPLFATVRVNGTALSGYLGLGDLVATIGMNCGIHLATCSCGEPGCAEVGDLLWIEHENASVIWEPEPTTAKVLGLSERQYRFEADAYAAALHSLREYMLANCEHDEIGPMIRETTFAFSEDEEQAKVTRAELGAYWERCRKWIAGQA